VSGALPPGSPLRDLAPAAGFGTAELRTVGVGLSALQVPVVLVLDDFQLITGTAVLESFGHLLAQQPPPLRLLIATRADPPLGLHRLRVSGDLTEIADTGSFLLIIAAASHRRLPIGSAVRTTPRHVDRPALRFSRLLFRQ